MARADIVSSLDTAAAVEQNYVLCIRLVAPLLQRDPATLPLVYLSNVWSRRYFRAKTGPLLSIDDISYLIPLDTVSCFSMSRSLRLYFKAK
jgi:hypothetical protein